MIYDSARDDAGVAIDDVSRYRISKVIC